MLKVYEMWTHTIFISVHLVLWFLQNTATTGDVVVHKAGGGTETYSSQYTYVSTGMAVVSSVSPSTVSVGGLSTLIFIFYLYF